MHVNLVEALALALVLVLATQPTYADDTNCWAGSLQAASSTTCYQLMAITKLSSTTVDITLNGLQGGCSSRLPDVMHMTAKLDSPTDASYQNSYWYGSVERSDSGITIWDPNDDGDGIEYNYLSHAGPCDTTAAYPRPLGPDGTQCPNGMTDLYPTGYHGGCFCAPGCASASDCPVCGEFCTAILRCGIDGDNVCYLACNDQTVCPPFMECVLGEHGTSLCVYITSATPSQTPTRSPTRTPSRSVTPTRTRTPSISRSPTRSRTSSKSMSATQTRSPTRSPTRSMSRSLWHTRSPSPTRSPSDSVTPSISDSLSPTPSPFPASANGISLGHADWTVAPKPDMRPVAPAPGGRYSSHHGVLALPDGTVGMVGLFPGGPSATLVSVGRDALLNSLKAAAAPTFPYLYASAPFPSSACVPASPGCYGMVVMNAAVGDHSRLTSDGDMRLVLSTAQNVSVGLPLGHISPPVMPSNAPFRVVNSSYSPVRVGVSPKSHYPAVYLVSGLGSTTGATTLSMVDTAAVTAANDPQGSPPTPFATTTFSGPCALTTDWRVLMLPAADVPSASGVQYIVASGPTAACLSGLAANGSVVWQTQTHVTAGSPWTNRPSVLVPGTSSPPLLAQADVVTTSEGSAYWFVTVFDVSGAPHPLDRQPLFTPSDHAIHAAGTQVVDAAATTDGSTVIVVFRRQASGDMSASEGWSWFVSTFSVSVTAASGGASLSPGSSWALAIPASSACSSKVEDGETEWTPPFRTSDADTTPAVAATPPPSDDDGGGAPDVAPCDLATALDSRVALIDLTNHQVVFWMSPLTAQSAAAGAYASDGWITTLDFTSGTTSSSGHTSLSSHATTAGQEPQVAALRDPQSHAVEWYAVLEDTGSDGTDFMLLDTPSSSLGWTRTLCLVLLVVSSVLTCFQQVAQVRAKCFNRTATKSSSSGYQSMDGAYEYHGKPNDLTGFFFGWQYDVFRLWFKHVAQIAILVAVFILQAKAVRGSSQFLDLLDSPEAFVANHVLPCSAGQTPQEWRQLCFCKGAPISSPSAPLCPSCDISTPCETVISENCLCDATLYGGTCGTCNFLNCDDNKFTTNKQLSSSFVNRFESCRKGYHRVVTLTWALVGINCTFVVLGGLLYLAMVWKFVVLSGVSESSAKFISWTRRILMLLAVVLSVSVLIAATHELNQSSCSSEGGVLHTPPNGCQFNTLPANYAILETETRTNFHLSMFCHLSKSVLYSMVLYVDIIRLFHHC